MKKLFFTLAILAGFAVQALAYDFQVDGIYYNVKSDSESTVSVTYGDEDYSGNIVIPGTVAVDGRTYTVVEIGELAFSDDAALASVIIPNTVTSIGVGAFKNCTGLTAIDIPNSVETIEGYYRYGAFWGCSNLVSIAFPNSLGTIGEYAFGECSGLTSIDLPNSLSEICQYAFYNCTSLVSINWPQNINELSLGVFCGCTSLESYIIPDHIVSIGDVAFSGCTNLSSITIPNSITHIGVNAFGNCTGLTSIALPSSVASIGRAAFSGCSSLESINIPDAVTVVSNSLFSGCSSLPEIHLHNAITAIGNDAFRGCESFTSFTVPTSCVSIGVMAFRECTRLASIDLCNVRKIKEDAFDRCDALEHVVIPNSVTYIEEAAFERCIGLKDVIVGNAVDTIGKWCFQYCSALQNVVMLGEEPPLLYGYGHVFEGCGEEVRLTVPCGSRSSYLESDWLNSIDEDRIVEDCNPYNIYVMSDESDNGVIPSATSAMMGEEITYSVELQPDYVFNGVVVYKADDETFRIPVADNKFVMPNFDVTVKADFEYLNIGEGQPEWYYEIQNENGSITYQHLEYAADTTINHKNVTVIIRTNTLYDKGEHTEVTREYIYEERLRGNKVYWWNKDLQEFTVLYDFGAQEGDSWVIKVGTASLTMHVDAVEQYEYEGRVFRMLQVSDDQGFFSGTIVCGIGHLSSFFPERLMSRSKNYRVEGMRCYWREGELFFKYGNRDCNEVYEEWHNGIEEDGPSTGIGTFTIYPNPTNGILTILHSEFRILHSTFHITNLMGQTVQTGSLNAETQQIDVSDLPQGMYFITVGEETRKFVVR